MWDECCERPVEFDAVVVSSSYSRGLLRVWLSDGNTVSGVMFNPGERELALAARGSFVRAKGHLSLRGGGKEFVLTGIEPKGIVPKGIEPDD